MAESLAQRRQMDQWLEFALRQDARAAPHPAPASLVSAAGGAMGYRLTLSHLECLPLFQAEDRNFDVRVGVTLFDEAAGCFFGHTARSTAVSYDMRKSKGKRGFHVDLDCSLYLHSRAVMSAGAGTGAGAGLLAIVEVVLVERCDQGVACGEYSAGWCAVPLELSGAGAAQAFQGTTAQRASGSVPGSPSKAAAAARSSMRSAPSSPTKATAGAAAAAAAARTSNMPGTPMLGSSAGTVAFDGSLAPLRSGILAARLGAGGSLCVPVFVGSPRYLLLRQVMPEQCFPPVQLLADGTECRLHYQFEACPEVGAWAPLAPDNCLISSRDVVPGVERTAGDGELTLGMLGIRSQLAPPRLHAVRAVVLAGLRVHLPDGFLEVIRKQAAGLWRQAHGAGAAPPLGSSALNGSGTAAAAAALSLHGGRLLPLRELQQILRLRVSVHNGRRFVGPPISCGAAGLEPVEGRRGEHELVLAQDAPLAWLPADRFMMVVVELLLVPNPQGSSSSSSSGGRDQLGTVLGWAAVAPFRWPQDGGYQPAVAEGMQQVALRSGPGRWLRHAPVLGWRRLIERTNRSSPQPPMVSFMLQHAPGQGIWPPPAAPVALRPALPAGRNLTMRPLAPGLAWAGRQHDSTEASEGQQLYTAGSEAETLVSVHAAPRQQQPLPSRLQGGAGSKVDSAGGKALAAAASVQAWQIHAHYNGAGTAVGGEQQELPPLPSIRTRPQQAQQAPHSQQDAAALYAGSPTAKQARRFGAAEGSSVGSAAEAVAAAAAAAVPAAAVAARHVSLAVELADPLVSGEASLQLLGFQAESGSSGSRQLPSRVHCTFRFFTSPPTVGAPMHLEPMPGCDGSPGSLYTLLPAFQCAASGGSSSSSGGFPAAPALPLQLLDTAALEQQVQLLAAQGVPQAAAAGLVRQLRLRTAQYLAERCLQVDVWDSDSLLQVGTLSVPLCGLMRQGLPAVEALLRVPVADPAQAVQRQDGSSDSSSSMQLCPSALRGSFLVRLACRGHRLHLPSLNSIFGGTFDWTGGCPSSVDGDGGDSSSLPASPMKRGVSGQPVVVRAKAALEEAGQVAHEVARQEGVSEAVEGQRLKDELVGRAASKLQRLLHYQALTAADSGSLGRGSGGGTAHEGAPQQQHQERAAAVGRLAERQLLGEVEAARERCKRDAILRRLQAELPCCVVLCAARGDTLAFEQLFANSSSEEAWFELTVGGTAAAAASGSSSSSGSTPGVLSLVTDAAQWQALAPHAGLAGLTAEQADGGSDHGSSGSSLQVVSSRRFKLAPHERCLLRFKLARCLRDEWQQQAQQATGTLSWHDISIRRMGGTLPVPGCTPAPAATLRVALLSLAAEPAVDRTLRLYCPAAAAGAVQSVVHAVQLAKLPGADRLLPTGSGGSAACRGLAFVASGLGVSAVLGRDGAEVLLSCPAAPAGTTQRILLAAHSLASSSSSSSSGRSISSNSSSNFCSSPVEVWEVFLHSLHVVQLTASVGRSVSASRLLPALAMPEGEHAAFLGSAAELDFHWQGGSSELQVSTAAGHAASSGGSPGGSCSRRLALRFVPAAICRRELLLSVVGRQQQVELLLVQLDSSGTAVSRTFEVQVERGQAVSKKVRYGNAYQQRRRFAVRSMQPNMLRIGQPSFELAQGASASIRLTFDAGSGSGSAGCEGQPQGGQQQQYELLAVLESSPAGTGSGGGGSGSKVEEVFRVLLTVT